VRRALTGAIAFRRPGARGRRLSLHPASLLSRSWRLSGPRERARGWIDRDERLLTGRPNPVLAGRKAVLEAEVARINARQTHSRGQVARLAARWAVERARAAGCHTSALEDLTTLEHRGLGQRTNVRVCLTMRGRIAAAIERAAELEGPRVVQVPARGTPGYRHLTAPKGCDGHAWAVRASCGHFADRDHLAAENVGCRALAPKAGRVWHKKTGEKLLAPRPKPARQRGAKTGPTPKRPGNQKQAGGELAAPPLRHPHPRGDTVRRNRNPRATTARSGPPLPRPPGACWTVLHAYRRRLKATPVP
jgi:hypothetical protein